MRLSNPDSFNNASSTSLATSSSPGNHPEFIMQLQASNASQINITNVISPAAESAMQRSSPNKRRRQALSSTMRSILECNHKRVSAGFCMECGEEFDPGNTPPAAQVAAFHLGGDDFPPPAYEEGDATTPVGTPSSHTPPGSPKTSPSSGSSGHASSDRDTLPSQLPRSALGIFTPDAKHIPTRRGAIRMVNIPPPQMYPDQVSGLGRPPTPYVTREASMPMPSMDGFGPPYGRQFGATTLDSSSSAEGNSMLELAARKLRGHRLNKGTVSDMNELFKSSDSELETIPDSSFESSLPVNSSLVSEMDWSHDNSFPGPSSPNEDHGQNGPPGEDLEAAIPETNTIPEVEQRGPNEVWSNALLAPRPSPTPLSEANMAHIQFDFGREETKSASSNSSGSTVASDSWNPAPPPLKENHELVKNLLLFKSITAPREMNLEYMTEEEVREENPLEEFEAGGKEHGIEIHDFACPWPASTQDFGKRRVRQCSPFVGLCDGVR